MDVKLILRIPQTAPSYVAPLSPRQLGIKLFEAGEPVDACTCISMRRGWLWALRASAWADGSEYLVRQGYVPFQGEPDADAGWPDYQREDYVGR